MAGIDYYRVLGLKRTSSDLEILTAFRKTVHEYGMGKLNDGNKADSRLVAFEAYDVLSNPFWRGLYDQFGEIAIKTGVHVDGEREMKQYRYSYHGDIFLTYKSVYGSTNPYTHVVSMLSNTKATLNSKKLEVIKIPLNLTLNELFYGTLKRINVPESDGTPYFVNLEISKGLPVDTEIIHNCAHRRIIFVTNDLPHADFVRSGRDLIKTYYVTLRHSIYGFRYLLKTLDGKLLRVNITQMITILFSKVQNKVHISIVTYLRSGNPFRVLVVRVPPQKPKKKNLINVDSYVYY